MELINQHNLKKISKILSYKRYKKILVVSGAKSYFSSGSDKVINNLISQKHKLIFLKKKKSPDYFELKKLIKTIKEFKPQIIFSCGGGAVMDLSKIANALAFEKNIKKKN